MRYLLLPFRTAPLLLVVFFTLAWHVAIYAHLFGLLLAILLVSWFFKYCYVLLDSVVTGEREPPVLSIEMVNPANEQRPLAQVGLIGLAGSLVGLCAIWLGRIPAMALAVVLLIALPATVAILAASDHWYEAAWPPSIIRCIRTLGRDYLAVALVVLAAGLLLDLCMPVVSQAIMSMILPMTSAPMPWVISAVFATLQLAFLMVFAYIGGALHENRLELGLATRTLDERITEAQAKAHAAERSAVLDRAYSLQRLRRIAEGWQLVEGWLKEHARGDGWYPEYTAVLASAASWDDPRIADRVADAYLGKLLIEGETGLALQVLEQRIALHPQFRPGPAVSARLKELAALAGKRLLQRQLGEDPGTAPAAGPVR